MRVAIAAGGTGGHFYPGLAVAKSLKARGDDVWFIVRFSDYVIPLLQRESIPFQEISGSGFRRSLSPANLVAVGKLVFGFVQCLIRFSFRRPNVVLVMGGYLSVPPALAARILGIPAVLHEQNVRPGAANRLLGRLVTRIALSFDASARFFAKSAVVTGNPVREELARLAPEGDARRKFGLDPDLLTILVFGGSLGAHRLNEWMASAAERWASARLAVQIAHFTGKTDVEVVRLAYQKSGIRHHVSEYCHDMPAAYAAADFVVCRAGASTVTELLAVRRPAVLVPYPFATENHQKDNADILARLNAGVVLEEKGNTADTFFAVVDGLARDRSRIARLRNGFNGLATNPFDATAAILRLVDEAKAR